MHAFVSYTTTNNTMTKRLMTSGSPFEHQIAYSRAVTQDGWIWVSGTTGWAPISTPTDHRYNYTTGQLDPDIVKQTEQAMLNIGQALTEAGASFSDIVRISYILPDRKDFPLTWPVLQKYLGDVKPAATMIQAGLMEPAMKIEIEVTAKR